MNSASSESRLPLYVLTGFLGSGKTSLLRHCLESDAFADTAVLVNEFGEIGLDHELVEASEEDTVVLKGGCICCTIREDLATTIRRLADLRREGRIKPFSRLVIETSGLADPVPVLITIRSDPRITQLFTFSGAIVTVDGVAGSATMDNHVESVRQVIYANRAVITKCDLATDTQIGELQHAIEQLNGDINVMRSNSDGVSPDALFSDLQDDAASVLLPLGITPAQQRQPSGLQARHESPTGNNTAIHSERFTSFSWEFDYELDWTAFGVWLTALLHAHGEKILRVKGILNVTGIATPVAVHGVQHMVYPPKHMNKWHDETRTSRLVFIVEGVSADRVRSSFDAFHALGQRIDEKDHVHELAAGTGRTVGGWPRRRARAASWLKG
jgi:G3E family GTPase